MANVLLLNGSPHAHGAIDLALTEVAQTLQECGLTTEIVHIGQQDIRGCIACGRCGVLHHCVFDDAVNALAPKFEAADALIVGSPVYYAAPNGSLIALLNRMFFAGSALMRLIGSAASHELRPGSPLGLAPRIPSRRQKTASAGVAGGGEPTMARPLEVNALQRGDTCHVDVVDKWGNMVSATPSGGWLQSSPAVPGLGFALGTRMQMFWLDEGLPGSLAPSTRPRTTLTPSLAYRDGKPYLAFGTPGGDQQEQWSLLLWLAHAVHGRPLQAAIETPAFHTNHMLASFWPREAQLGSLVLESRFPAATIAGLKARGHEVTLGGPWSEGRLSACALDRQPGGSLLRAAANPRGMQGYAIAR